MTCPVCGRGHRTALVGFTGMNRKCAAKARNGSTYIKEVYRLGWETSLHQRRRR